jgi:DNA-directed RNA polymerase subunit beta'
MKNSITSTPYVFRNLVIDKGQLKKVMNWSFSKYDLSGATLIADRLKDLGFQYATKAGISLSIEDLKVPEIKKSLINNTYQEVNETEQKFLCGNITSVERFQKVIDTWNDTSEALKDEVVTYFRETDPLNSIYMMAFSGARGNISQVRQLVGMRGLMSDPQGQIIDLPITTNFREGLTVTEYIISSYGARKGLVDTALRTADSGYLTRRLVDVAQDIIVREINCGTDNGITVDTKDSKGRVLLSDVLHPTTGETLAFSNSEITHRLLELFKKNNLDQIFVRSPLTCESHRSVCQFCYGWNLAYGKMVDLGEAVGIIAAQSIGEPGTQLTMRTFHTGGVFTGESAGQVRAPFTGVIKLPGSFKCTSFRTRHGNNSKCLDEPITLTLKGYKDSIKLNLTEGMLLLVNSGETVRINQILVESAPDKTTITERATKDVITNISGEVSFGNLVVEERIDKQGNRTIVNQKSGLIWVVSGDVYDIPSTTKCLFEKNKSIDQGSVVAKTHFLNTLAGFVSEMPTANHSYASTSNTVSSIFLSNASVLKETSENVIRFDDYGIDFSLTVPLDTPVIHSQVIAEQINSEYITQTGGTVFFEESDDYTNLLWIPEETYEVNKDLSLLLVDDSTFVEAGVEITSEIISKVEGFVKITHQNNILKEVSIRPGILYPVSALEDVSLKDQTFVNAGEELLGTIKATQLTYLEVVTTYNGDLNLLARPVTTYKVDTKEKVVLHESSFDGLSQFVELRIINEFLVKDGSFIKSNQGLCLVNTQLYLDIDEEIAKAININSKKFRVNLDVIEVNNCPKFHLTLTEALSFHSEGIKETAMKKTTFFVESKQYIKPSTVVVQDDIICLTKGKVRQLQTENQTVKKVLVTSNSDEKLLTIKGSSNLKIRDFIRFKPNSLNCTKDLLGQILDKKDDTYKIRIARPYLISKGAVLNVNHENLVQLGDLLSVLVYERPKTGDIVQGLPRIEEVLEGRRPKDPCKLASIDGSVSIAIDSDISEISISDKLSDTVVTQKLDNRIIVSNNEVVSVGQPLTDGKMNPHDLLSVYFLFYKEKYGLFEGARVSLQKIQRFLVNEIQEVYQSQGVTISDKHVEVIVRQMTSKVRIVNGGNTTLLPEELVDLYQIKRIDQTVARQATVSADYFPVLLGITKASLNTESFISAASFQETTRVLTEAAIEGKTDWLRGLKENVIIGRLIPAGTGFNNLYSNLYDDNSTLKPISKIPKLTEVSTKNKNPLDLDDIILDDRTARILNDS